MRLKHKDAQGVSSEMQKTTNHTVSHGAGVLLGNLQYGDETLLREYNNSQTSGNLKSVYDMRVSHSNLAKGGGKPVPSDAKGKRKHL